MSKTVRRTKKVAGKFNAAGTLFKVHKLLVLTARTGHIPPAGRIETFHTNPKRQRGSDLRPSLALRVGVKSDRGPYKVGSSRIGHHKITSRKVHSWLQTPKLIKDWSHPNRAKCSVAKPAEWSSKSPKTAAVRTGSTCTSTVAGRRWLNCSSSSRTAVGPRTGPVLPPFLKSFVSLCVGWILIHAYQFVRTKIHSTEWRWRSKRPAPHPPATFRRIGATRRFMRLRRRRPPRLLPAVRRCRLVVSNSISLAACSRSSATDVFAIHENTHV
jgi:hypothetical protein